MTSAIALVSSEQSHRTFRDCAASLRSRRRMQKVSIAYPPNDASMIVEQKTALICASSDQNTVRILH